MVVELLSLPVCFAHEATIADFLRSASGPNPHAARLCGPAVGVGRNVFTDDFLADVGPGGGPLMTPEAKVGEEWPHLDTSQKAAVVAAIKNRALLISGMAGGGKTFLVNAIANLYGDAGLRVALCAPTGKAARRLEQATNRKANTIHRLLEFGYAGSAYSRTGDYGGEGELRTRHETGFARNASNPLDENVVICDEASMVDAGLAAALLSAVGPQTAVVMVGDHHQLPPVGAGALLRDCIQHRLLPLSLLTTCHRQAGPLKTSAAAILEGRIEPTFTVPKGIRGPWYVDRRLDAPEAVTARVQMLWTRVFKEWGCDRAKDVQFVTPMHKGPLGTLALSTMLQRLYQAERGVTVEPVGVGKRTKLHEGDRVINTHNNYTLNVMNGQTGVVLDADDLTIDFDGRGEVEIPKECRAAIELAYCLTVHKMQGSQTQTVAFICHKAHSFMLNRSLLYTACTRPTQTMILLGDEAGLRRAAGTVVVDERKTLLPAMMGIGT